MILFNEKIYTSLVIKRSYLCVVSRAKSRDFLVVILLLFKAALQTYKTKTTLFRSINFTPFFFFNLKLINICLKSNYFIVVSYLKVSLQIIIRTVLFFGLY